MPRELVANQRVEDFEGARRALWDYRQKAHVALWRGGAEDPNLIKGFKREARARQDRLQWLNVVPALALEEPEFTGRAVDLIDRYGRLWKTVPWDARTAAELFDEVENEFLYYEARHC